MIGQRQVAALCKGDGTVIRFQADKPRCVRTTANYTAQERETAEPSVQAPPLQLFITAQPLPSQKCDSLRQGADDKRRKLHKCELSLHTAR